MRQDLCCLCKYCSSAALQDLGTSVGTRRNAVEYNRAIGKEVLKSKQNHRMPSRTNKFNERERSSDTKLQCNYYYHRACCSLRNIVNHQITIWPVMRYILELSESLVASRICITAELGWAYITVAVAAVGHRFLNEWPKRAIIWNSRTKQYLIDTTSNFSIQHPVTVTMIQP